MLAIVLVIAVALTQPFAGHTGAVFVSPCCVLAHAQPPLAETPRVRFAAPALPVQRAMNASAADAVDPKTSTYARAPALLIGVGIDSALGVAPFTSLNVDLRQ